jgi:D-3-phosphoglycerate dehydrogenase
VKILVVGDAYMPVTVFSDALSHLHRTHGIRYLQIDENGTFAPTTDSERSIREYVGTPKQLIEALVDDEILVVHGAPVTEEVIAAAPCLRLVCCARGGPVNVDLGAASRQGVLVVNTPGKNADAVAELTIALMIMLARGIRPAQAFVEAGGVPQSAFEGKRFFGSNLSGKTLGVIGFGSVGRQVASRALGFEMKVVTYDPLVAIPHVREGGVKSVELTELIARSDFVSLHARATPENENLFGADEFAAMKRGAYFINTARETLVDEEALVVALSSGHLGGAALDVVRAQPKPRFRLLEFPNVVLTPHIGGATHDTLLVGARMLAEEIERFARKTALRWLANREVLVHRDIIDA